MRNSKKPFIFPLIFLYFLCMLKISKGEDDCTTMSCKTLNDIFDISVAYPFRLVNGQSESCGSPGFDVYCDDKLGFLLELPNAGNFTIDALDGSLRLIELSDPNNCLPNKLLSLDLSAITPLQLIDKSEDFWVYNCSSVGDFSDPFGLYDKIDCLSGSNYTVLSVSLGPMHDESNCALLKTVSVPLASATFGNYSKLSNFSSIELSWDTSEYYCDSCGNSVSSSGNGGNTSDWSVIEFAGVAAGVALALLIFCVCCRVRPQPPSGRNVVAPVVATTSTNQAISQGQSSTPSNNVHRGGGLDQVTIDSYPIVLIGKSGRLIKPDDGICSICLMDYLPGDNLKILPECLHRFHVGCIDLWLSAESTCPICRTFPSRNS